MANSLVSGDGHHQGAARDRSQVQNPRNDRWAKRDADNGRVIKQSNNSPFLGIRKEH